jgi:hypothetical protein
LWSQHGNAHAAAWQAAGLTSEAMMQLPAGPVRFQWTANEVEPRLPNVRQQRQLTRDVRNEWGGWGSNPRPADYENAGLLPWLPHQRLCRSNPVSTPPVRPFRRIPIATVIASRSDDGSNGSNGLAYRSHTGTKNPVTRRDQTSVARGTTTTAPDPSTRPQPRSLPVNSANDKWHYMPHSADQPSCQCRTRRHVVVRRRDHAKHAAALY